MEILSLTRCLDLKRTLILHWGSILLKQFYNLDKENWPEKGRIIKISFLGTVIKKETIKVRELNILTSKKERLLFCLKSNVNFKFLCLVFIYLASDSKLSWDLHTFCIIQA